MRIAYILGDFPVRSETFILNQITGLIDRGHDVEIFANRPRRPAPLDSELAAYDLLGRTFYRPWSHSLPARLFRGLGLTLLHLPSTPRTALRAINPLRYGLLAAGGFLACAAQPFRPSRCFDAIVCHFGPYGLLATALRDLGLLAGPICTFFHGYDVTTFVARFGPRVYDPLFRSGELFLPISAVRRERLMQLGCPAERTTVHHMGIDCRRFRRRVARRPDGRTGQIITVARLEEVKGLEYGIRAVARLIRAGAAVRYDVLGGGPLHVPLQRLIASQGLVEVARLHGPVSHAEVVEWMARADVLLAPSITTRRGEAEGIPVVLMEAMAMELPVVSTQYSGIPELVSHGCSGFLAPERDEGALAHYLSTLLEDAQLREQMGQRGREIVLEHFNIDRLNDELAARLAKLGSEATRDD